MSSQSAGSDDDQRVPPFDDGAGVITKTSQWSVGDTVSRLAAAATAKGMKVFAVIDHSGEAKNAGLALHDTKVVIFGSPRVGTPVMVSAPLSALDLPLKLLVWADGDQTKVSYTATHVLAERYNLSDELAGPLAGIETLTDAVLHEKTSSQNS